MLHLAFCSTLSIHIPKGISELLDEWRTQKAFCLLTPQHLLLASYIRSRSKRFVAREHFSLPSSDFYSRTCDRPFLCNHILQVYFHCMDISKQSNHRLPQFIYASDICHFAIYFSLKTQSPNTPRENANREIIFVKLPSNTFSRLVLWLALEVLTKRKWSATVWNSPPCQLPTNHSSV